jgi:hypothetical protein
MQLRPRPSSGSTYETRQRGGIIASDDEDLPETDQPIRPPIQLAEASVALDHFLALANLVTSQLYSNQEITFGTPANTVVHFQFGHSPFTSQFSREIRSYVAGYIHKTKFDRE